MNLVGKNILIMHPDAGVVARLSQVFGQMGFVVIVAPAPIQDPEELKASSPDLVVMADAFRASTGEPLASWLRRVADVPILAVCPSGDVLAGVKMLEMGADDYITPTLGSREIVARANGLLRRATQARRGRPGQESGRAPDTSPAGFDTLQQ